MQTEKAGQLFENQDLTPNRKKYQKELDLEIALKGLQDEDLTEEEYLEEVERIIKCNEEVATEEVIGTKEVIIKINAFI